MATTELKPWSQDRLSRRRPFANWMKRLASLKNGGSRSLHTIKRGDQHHGETRTNSASMKNNPYPISGRQPARVASTTGALTPPSRRSLSFVSPVTSRLSFLNSQEGTQAPVGGTKSIAPTISTLPDTAPSETAQSKTETTATGEEAKSLMCASGGEGSTFSSPTPSVRSITTTLTTMQSFAPSQLLSTGVNNVQAGATGPHTAAGSGPSAQSSHQFSSSPVLALPPHMSHLNPAGYPLTYTAATANNILSDNASVVTLASSSKRRRRNTLDTNASIRALAPSSLYGGSKESLSLTPLSSNVNDLPGTSIHQQPSRSVSVSLANVERASVYSSSGVAPGLSADRLSHHAPRQGQGDGGSVRSGRLGHLRNNSLTVSNSAMAASSLESPLGSPKDPSRGTK